ncbi:MAG: aldehyde dehydrogenase family protein, partial [Bacteroidales bacterium]
GKSPCIVTEKADLEITAHRIIWGKLLNAGQTCIAPDYILVDKKIKTELIKKLKKYILQDFGANPLLSEHYPRIISQEATERLTSLINNESPNILFGGQTDIIQRYVAPTLIDEPAPDGKLMQEEIFGPILPILGYDKIEDAITFVNKKDKPLALYFFGNKQDAKQVMQSTSSGGMCVNDTIMHIVNSHLPFGGVGKSGMGNYHGHASFLTFSHSRSVHTGSWVPDFKFRYAPYKLPQIIKRFL